MALKVNIHDAKTNLSKLINMAVEGEEIIIARDGEALIRLTPIKKHKKRTANMFKNDIVLSEDIDKPLPDKVVQEFYR